MQVWQTFLITNIMEVLVFPNHETKYDWWYDRLSGCSLMLTTDKCFHLTRRIKFFATMRGFRQVESHLTCESQSGCPAPHIVCVRPHTDWLQTPYLHTDTTCWQSSHMIPRLSSQSHDEHTKKQRIHLNTWHSFESFSARNIIHYSENKDSQ